MGTIDGGSDRNCSATFSPNASCASLFFSGCWGALNGWSNRLEIFSNTWSAFEFFGRLKVSDVVLPVVLWVSLSLDANSRT